MDFYKLTKDEVLDYFSININKGISKIDLKYKLNKFGKNIFEVKKDETFFDLFLIQSKSFLNLLLIFLVIFAFIVWIFTNRFEHLLDSIIILVIFLFNSIIGAYQNFSAKKIAKTLNSMLENEAIVLRDSKKIKIKASELFPGDIIYLSSGDKIPADCYIFSSDDLKVNESMITGESLSVQKNNCTYKKSVSISERKNILFMNSFVISGDAICIITNTGKNTEIGKIASSIQEIKKKESFLDEIDDASKKISYFAITLIIFVSIILYFKGANLLDIFLVGSALIIGSIPEGLPAIVVFLLSKSIHKLSKNKVLVKDMGLLETLGGIDILCTDKTGTLTENKMSLKRFFVGGKEINNFEKLEKKIKEILLKTIFYVNEVKFINGEYIGDPEDTSLINYVEDLGFKFSKFMDDKNILKLEPFNSINKFSYCDLKKENIRLKKGAPDVIIENCKYIIENGKKIILTPKKKVEIMKIMKTFTDESLRLIGFSYLENINENHNLKLNSNKEVFVGFCGLYDKPKKDIDKTIISLYNAGVEIKMITGDNKNTAIAIAKECSFRNISAISYDELIKLSEKEFEKEVLSKNIFARMTPDLKQKILIILQKNKHKVAITGDGVNDSIALRQANVGVVMGSGSDLAKESGDLILIDDNFNNLPLAIKEGRGVFHNIRKVVNYLLTANLAEVLTILVSSFFGLIPFTAIQILWVNFVTDIAPAMTLGIDKFPKNILNKKPNGDGETIINKRILFLTIFISIKKVILIFILFILAYNYSPFENKLIFAQTISFTWLVLTHFVRIAAIRFDEKVSFFSNKYLNYSLFFVILLQLLIIYTPIRDLFRVKIIPFKWLVLLISFILIGIVLAKLITVLVSYLLKKYFNEIENY